MNWEVHIAEVEAAMQRHGIDLTPSPEWLRWNRISYELSYLTGDFYPRIYLDIKTLLAFLKQEMQYYADLGAEADPIKSYCLKEIRSLYGRS